MNKSLRYHSLDSLRGLASMQVIVGHCITAIPALLWLIFPQKGVQKHDFFFYLVHSPLRFFWNASPAVIVFFVLSGFVLSLPYYGDTNRQPKYLIFFVKRIIRLYLPCLCVILLSVLLKYLLYKPNTVPEFSFWVNDIWTRPETAKEWINRLLLRQVITNVDSALWTLPIEIKLSLLLPFFVFFIKRLKKAWPVIAVAGFTICYYSLALAKMISPSIDSLFYFNFFLWGAILGKYRVDIAGWINNRSDLFFYTFLVLSLIIYTFDFTLWWLPDYIMKALRANHDYVTGVAAVMFIVIVLSERSQELFNSKVLVFIGKISFSLYLIHPLVIISLAYLLHQYFNVYIIIMVAFLASMLLSLVFYRLVEIPSLNMANKIATRVGYKLKILKSDNKKD